MSKHPAVRFVLRLWFWFNVALRLVPHGALWRFSSNRELISKDVSRWAEAFLDRPTGAPARFADFATIMLRLPEFRALFYYRVGGISRLFWFLARPMECLSLYANSIGPGLVIQHGIGSVIVAEKIGTRCWINQQVTLGAGGPKPGFPTLGDEVGVGAGAKLLGGIVVGDRARIGANAVVVKDVPPDVTVVGVPAYIVRRDGVRVREEL